MPDRTDTVPQLIQPGDLQRKLAISKATLWRMVKDHRLPTPYHLGGRVRGFDVREVEAMLREMRPERDA